MTSLMTLVMSSNEQTGTLPTELGQLTNLESLALDNNLFSGVLPTELGRLGVLGTWKTS